MAAVTLYVALTDGHGRLSPGVYGFTLGSVAALVAAGSDDARALWSIVALLGVIGVALVMLAVAVVKATRPDRELLAPLEVMGRRKWRRSDPVWQRRELDAVRPPDAVPLSPAPAVPVRLEGFDEGPQAGGFADLADDDGGVAADLVELPGGGVIDTDPTPPSGEVPVVRADGAPALPVRRAGEHWNAPAATDAPVLTDPPDDDAPEDETEPMSTPSDAEVDSEADEAEPAEPEVAPDDSRRERSRAELVAESGLDGDDTPTDGSGDVTEPDTGDDGQPADDRG